MNKVKIVGWLSRLLDVSTSCLVLTTMEACLFIGVGGETLCYSTTLCFSMISQDWLQVSRIMQTLHYFSHLPRQIAPWEQWLSSMYDSPIPSLLFYYQSFPPLPPLLGLVQNMHSSSNFPPLPCLSVSLHSSPSFSAYLTTMATGDVVALTGMCLIEDNRTQHMHACRHTHAHPTITLW